MSGNFTMPGGWSMPACSAEAANYASVELLRMIGFSLGTLRACFVHCYDRYYCS